MIDNNIGQDVRVKGSKRRLNKQYAMVLLGVVAVCVSAAPSINSWLSTDVSMLKNLVSTTKVTRGVFSQDFSASGAIVASHAPRLSSTETGMVELLVKPGERVTAGQVVAKIDSPELHNQLAQQTSILAQFHLQMRRLELQGKRDVAQIERDKDDAQIILNAAHREYLRASRSRAEKLISDIDYQQRKDERLAAQLRYKHAEKAYSVALEMNAFETEARQFELKQRELDVAEMERRVAGLSMRSPVEGVIGNWLLDNASQVQAQQPLISVIDYSNFEIELTVSPAYTAEIYIGMPVTVMVSGRQLAAEIYAISPELQNNMLMVHARFTDSEDMPEFRQNQFINTKLHIRSEEDTLLLTRGPFFDSGQRKYVFVIDENNVAQKRTVLFGKVGINQVQVLDGLLQGDTVISSAVDEFLSVPQILLR